MFKDEGEAKLGDLLKNTVLWLKRKDGFKPGFGSGRI
jgi:hypothetical protein